MSKVVAELHTNREELRSQVQQIEPEKVWLSGSTAAFRLLSHVVPQVLDKVHEFEAKLEALAKERERGSEATNQLHEIEEELRQLKIKKKELVGEVGGASGGCWCDCPPCHLHRFSLCRLQTTHTHTHTHTHTGKTDEKAAESQGTIT